MGNEGGLLKYLISIYLIAILTDVVEHGPEAFAFQIVISDDKKHKKELSTLISSQFLSYLDFAERMH